MAQAFGTRVYVKKQLRLDLLSWQQREMLLLGTTAVNQVKLRLAKGQNANDVPAKPLGKRWAAIKRNMHLKPLRDLRGSGFAFGNALSRAKKRRKTGKRFVGHMLDEFKVRTVGQNFAKAGVSSYAASVKALGNNLREVWIALSPTNAGVVRERWKEQARAKFANLIKAA